MTSKKDAAEQYLEKHQVADTLSAAIAAAIRSGTDDPLGFIVDNLKAKVSGERPVVFFVLGGPGAGKGTQCARIVEQLGYTHLSAGDLLRAERTSGSAQGAMIDGYITEGKIVPVEVTITLLLSAIEASGGTHFLIDGFPRNTNNLSGWQATVGDKLQLAGVLMYEVSEEVSPNRPPRTRARGATASPAAFSAQTRGCSSAASSISKPPV
jgi:adenylate kinase family enzyme